MPVETIRAEQRDALDDCQGCQGVTHAFRRGPPSDMSGQRKYVLRHNDFVGARSLLASLGEPIVQTWKKSGPLFPVRNTSTKLIILLSAAQATAHCGYLRSSSPSARLITLRIHASFCAIACWVVEGILHC